VVQFFRRLDVVTDPGNNLVRGHSDRFTTHVGRRSLRFFSTRRMGAKGGTAPEAFPTETRVPFRLSSLKLLSKLIGKLV
jgi:hypothetical protein